jgi:hypothetical protein
MHADALVEIAADLRRLEDADNTRLDIGELNHVAEKLELYAGTLADVADERDQERRAPRGGGRR